ncbi:MAG: SDR family oxidoreductase [Candidatus Sericytochromatia bacterium]
MKARTGAALITGGARRLGRVMALTLAARGYDLVLHHRSSAEEAHNLAALAADFGAQTHLIQGDLEDMHFVQSLVTQAQTVFPHLNLLLNNASAFYPQRLQDTDLATLDTMLNLHLKAPLLLTRDFAQHCGTGQIVNLIDTQVLKQPTDYVPYILSKKALHELTALSAKALGPQIRVNAIAPGYILPPVAGNEDDGERQIARTPLKRSGTSEDITRALEALLDNDFLTGQVLWVDGGQRL